MPCSISESSAQHLVHADAADLEHLDGTPRHEGSPEQRAHLETVCLEMKVSRSEERTERAQAKEPSPTRAQEAIRQRLLHTAHFSSVIYAENLTAVSSSSPSTVNTRKPGCRTGPNAYVATPTMT